MKPNYIKFIAPVFVGTLIFCFQNCSQNGSLKVVDPVSKTAVQGLQIETISLDQIQDPPESFVQPTPADNSSEETIQVSFPSPSGEATIPIQVVVSEQPPVVIEQEEPKLEEVKAPDVVEVIAEEPKQEEVKAPEVVQQDPVVEVKAPEVVQQDPVVEVIAEEPKQEEVKAPEVVQQDPVVVAAPVASVAAPAAPEQTAAVESCEGSLGFSLKVSRIEFQCKTNGSSIMTSLAEGKNTFNGTSRSFEFSMSQNYNSSCSQAKIYLANDSFVLANKSSVLSIKPSASSHDGIIWFSGQSKLEKNRNYRLSNLTFGSGKSQNEKEIKLEKGADGKCYVKGQIHLQADLEAL